MTTIAVIGAGHIGSSVARAAVRAGYDVIVSNASGPQSLAKLVSELGRRAQAATVQAAAQAGDVVVVSVPVGAFADIPAGPLAGKIVISTSNYNASREGHIAEVDDGQVTIAGLLQRCLPGSRVVKAFNMITAAEVPADGTPPGTPDRRALALAGDDAAARNTVAEIIDRMGYDPVDAGPLSESWRFDRGQPAFGTRQNAGQLRVNLEHPHRQ
jgi:8-hydroxy-5-deazaflavin:NADPH oxidoreductase